MKVYAINGSPRRNRNTAKMLDKVLEGVKAEFPDAEVERINLFDLKFTSCKVIKRYESRDQVSTIEADMQMEVNPDE